LIRDAKTHHVLALLAVVAVLAAFFTLMFVDVPPANQDAVMLILGAILTTAFGSVYSFYFGTTRGSDSKNEALNASAKATADLAETAKTAGAVLAAATGNGSGALDGTVRLQPGDSVDVVAERPAADPDELPPDLRVNR
jgi:hypothetical protein